MYLLLIYRGMSSSFLQLSYWHRKSLFLISLVQVLCKIHDQCCQNHPKRPKLVSTRINKTFRINLIKPCKSLKDLLSYFSYDSYSRTCQYHGIRYLVCPEMEFDIFCELILGRLNVKHPTKQ